MGNFFRGGRKCGDALLDTARDGRLQDAPTSSCYRTWLWLRGMCLAGRSHVSAVAGLWLLRLLP